MSKFEFILVDVKQKEFRAVWLIKLSQMHHKFTESKLKNESSVLCMKNLSNISNQVQSCWSLFIFNEIALQLFSHKNVSLVKDLCIKLFINFVLIILTLSMTSHNINIHLSFDEKFIQIDAEFLIDLLMRCNIHITFINSCHEAPYKILKQFQYEFFLNTSRSSESFTVFLVLQCIFFLIQIKNNLYQFVKSWNMFKDCINEVWNINSKTWKKFLFQCIIDLLFEFECVFKVAHVEESRCLLKQWCKEETRWWRSCWL